MRHFGNAVATPTLTVCHTLPMRSAGDTIRLLDRQRSLFQHSERGGVSPLVLGRQPVRRIGEEPGG